MKDIIGLILCGGKSSRMGQDKGLLQRGNQVWSSHLQYEMQQAGIAKVWFSVGKHNHDAYEKQFPSATLVLDTSLSNIPSPFVGLLSAWKSMKAQGLKLDLLVLACDMQLVDAAVLQLLLDKYRHDQGKDAYVFVDGKFLQPLVAIYTYEGLKEIDRLSQMSEWENQSVKAFIQALDAVIIPVPNQMTHKLANFNRPEDLVGKGI